MIERYTSRNGNVWTEEAKYRAWLQVQLAVCLARSDSGDPSDEAMISPKGVLLRRAHNRREETTTSIAFVTNVAENAGTSPPLPLRPDELGRSISGGVATQGSVALSGPRRGHDVCWRDGAGPEHVMGAGRRGSLGADCSAQARGVGVRVERNLGSMALSEDVAPSADPALRRW